VFVPNATTGVNTVLRNLVFKEGDVIIYFATTYGACVKTVEYIVETTPAEARQIQYTYPLSDKDFCAAFEKTIQDLKAEGKNPKIAMFDTISSLPGVRTPFERMTEICRANNILSLIDGAHSVGQIEMDLTALDPDFYVSNCHKWLFVPRGCAVFYVPVRNQHLMRSSLPTSHGFVPRGEAAINNPLPPSTKSEFINNMEFTATLDLAPYLCVPAALKWRSKVVFGKKRGEEAILAYCQQLARDGGKLVADAFESKVMDNEEGSLTKCSMVNVPLPGLFEQAAGGETAKAAKIVQ
jgi:selenocysteine lyase/cysteine desulfurase